MSLKKQIATLRAVSEARTARAERALARAHSARQMAERARVAAEAAAAEAISDEAAKRAALMAQFIDHPSRMTRVNEVMTRFKGYRARVAQAEADKAQAAAALKEAEAAIHAAQKAVYAAKQEEDRRALAFSGHLAALDRAATEKAEDRRQDEWSAYAARQS